MQAAKHPTWEALGFAFWMIGLAIVILPVSTWLNRKGAKS